MSAWSRTSMDVSSRTAGIISALETRASFMPGVPQASRDGLLDLYEALARAFARLQSLRRRGGLDAVFEPVRQEKRSRSRYHGLSERWVPEEISRHIETHVTRVLSYTAAVDGRTVVIEFGMTEDQLDSLEEYDGHVDFILLWLMVCGEYAPKTCAGKLTIRLFLTPFTKTVPRNKAAILGPDSVNTGYATRCAPSGEIVIFREEEWRKVFIHETFHAYGLDFAPQPTDLTQRMACLFHVRSSYRVAEAYTEAWARICNSAVVAYASASRPPTKDEYLQNVVFNLGVERMFSCIQCQKVLEHMGLSYQSLIGGTLADEMLRENLYRENTSVLAYYVITACLIADYPGFIAWCRRNNTSLLRFRATKAAFASFGTLIESSALSREFERLMREMEGVDWKDGQESLVMSAVEGSADREN